MGPLVAALPVISMVSGVVGAGVSAVGSYEAGQAQSANAAYQSQVARNNAQVAQQNAAWTTESGEATAATQGQKARASIGSIEAAQGANNVDVNTGSAADVRAGAKGLANTDTKTIMSNAARTAFGYQVAATSDTGESELLSSESKQAAVGGDIGALGSFLSGISSVGNNWAKFQQFGTGATSAGVNPGVGTSVGIGMA